MLPLLLATHAALLTPTPSSSRSAVERVTHTRREALLSTAAASVLALGSAPLPAAALIKGSAPPPKKSGPKERKCKSIDECEALGEAERKAQEANQDTAVFRTVGGDRYRDLKEGDGKDVKNGDAVEIRYRVMRLGTKARDGLSGEGQTIFSYGYGEDEDKEGDKLPVQLTPGKLVPGVNDAIVGMKPGGRRRVLVRPERGWRIETGACKESVDAKVTTLDATQRTAAEGGNLVFKADIGAAIENETACQNKVSLPQPQTYGAKARFGRRFDESLMVEVDLVGFTDSSAVAAAATKGGGSAFVYDKCKSNPFADGCDDGEPVK